MSSYDNTPYAHILRAYHCTKELRDLYTQRVLKCGDLGAKKILNDKLSKMSETINELEDYLDVWK